MHHEDSHAKITKIANSGFGEEKQVSAENGNATYKSERKHKKGTGECSTELAGYLTLQLHAQETLWNTNVGSA